MGRNHRIRIARFNSGLGPRGLALVTALHTSASRSYSEVRARLHELSEEIHGGGNFDVDVLEDRGSSGAIGRSCGDRSEAAGVSMGRQWHRTNELFTASVATFRGGDV